MDNLLEQVGKKCIKGKEVTVLRSAAGYYVGTFDEEGPYCRLSQCYGKTIDDPIINTERDCVENNHCNGGSVGRCRFKLW